MRRSYKSIFLNHILMYIYHKYEHGCKLENSQDIYDAIPFGNGINEYIKIDEYTYNNDFNYYSYYFNLKSLNKEGYIDSIDDNIYRFLVDYFNINNNLVGHSLDVTFDNFMTVLYYEWFTPIDIDEKEHIDFKDLHNVNADVYSIREACENERNNEFKELKKDYIYVCGSTSLYKKNILIISKKYIFDGLKEYVNKLLTNEPLDFNEEVFYEFLKLLKFNTSITFN